MRHLKSKPTKMKYTPSASCWFVFYVYFLMEIILYFEFVILRKFNHLVRNLQYILFKSPFQKTVAGMKRIVEVSASPTIFRIEITVYSISGIPILYR